MSELREVTAEALCGWFVAVCVFLLAAVMIAGCGDREPASMSPAEVAEASSRIPADLIDEAIEYHGGHHAEFFQQDGRAAWFIVDSDGVLLARVDLVE